MAVDFPHARSEVHIQIHKDEYDIAVEACMSLNLPTHAHCMHIHLCWLPRKVITVLCVFVLDTDRWGRAVKPRFLFSFVGVNIYNFASLHVHPQQLASAIIQITTFSFPVSFILHFFTSSQVNQKDPISWRNWIHYHFNNREQWESYGLILKMKGNRGMGRCHGRAAKRALTHEVCQRCGSKRKESEMEKEWH